MRTLLRRPVGTKRLKRTTPVLAFLQRTAGLSIKKRRKRMRKKKHKKMLKATRWQRRAGK